MKVVFSPPLLGLMPADAMEGGVFRMVTDGLLTGIPLSSPSFGVAVQTRVSLLSNEAPVMDELVTEGLPLTVHW